MNRSPRGLKGFALHVLPFLAYCILLFLVSGMPQPPTPDLGIDWGDKLLHAGAFFVMTLLAWRAATWLFPGRKRIVHIVIAVGFASFYGATDEFHQSFVEERSADVLDWLADTVGAVVAGLVLARR